MEAHSDIQDMDLKGLLEIFGSACTLEDIASAYCQAGYDIGLASEILCESHNTVANINISAYDDKFKGANQALILSSAPGASVEPAKMSLANESMKSSLREITSGAPKSKLRPASLGTVSGFVGRNHIQPQTSKKEYSEATKPLKLDAKELPASEIWGEKSLLSMTAAKGTMNNDLVSFLFKMLGDGFDLDKNKIHETLGLCGYDVRKTMENLLDISASTLGKSDDVLELADGRSIELYAEVESASSEEAGTIVCNSTDSPKRDKDRFGLQKEILEALFTFPERSEENPKRRPAGRGGPYGEPVMAPPQETTTYRQTAVEESHVIRDENDNDDENSFEALRRAVREYWVLMKEYYRAAVEAFAKGDLARADKLLEEGHFFNRKAREADEKSAQKVLESKVNKEDAVPLDLLEHEPKEALRLLRLHLTSLSGIVAIKYLRVIAGTGAEDPKGARKRLITKQLERDSIKWTEEDNGRTMRIQIDKVDPKRLSFSKKT